MDDLAVSLVGNIRMGNYHNPLWELLLTSHCMFNVFFGSSQPNKLEFCKQSHGYEGVGARVIKDPCGLDLSTLCPYISSKPAKSQHKSIKYVYQTYPINYNMYVYIYII